MLCCSTSTAVRKGWRHKQVVTAAQNLIPPAWSPSSCGLQTEVAAAVNPDGVREVTSVASSLTVGPRSPTMTDTVSTGSTRKLRKFRPPT